MRCWPAVVQLLSSGAVFGGKSPLDALGVSGQPGWAQNPLGDVTGAGR